eukprot:tig00020800_g13741.t1
MSPEEHLRACARFLQRHADLAAFEPIDMLLEDAAWRPPPEWERFLDGLPLGAIQRLPVADLQTELRRAPETLRAFVGDARALALPRAPLRDPAISQRRHAELAQRLLRRTAQKKGYEALEMAEMVHEVSLDVNTSTVIDVGAGQGCLAQVLAGLYGLNVIAVEANAAHTERLRERVARVPESPPGPGEEGEGDVGAVYSRTLTVDAATGEEALWAAAGDAVPGRRAVLTALHGCGDLVSNLLRLYARSPSIRGAVLVGCCYQKLTEEGCTSDPRENAVRRPEAAREACGLPLSSAAREEGYRMGWPARNLAVKSPERFAAEAGESFAQGALFDSYRAALQPLLAAHCAHLPPRDRVIGKLPKGQLGGFPEYASAALGRLDPAKRGAAVEALIQDPEPLAAAGAWAPWMPARVAWLHALRAVLAPVLETYVLLDRLCFAREAVPGSDCSLVPLFDARLSPRNVALVLARRPAEGDEFDEAVTVDIDAYF